MNYKNFIQTLGFAPKENTSGIFNFGNQPNSFNKIFKL